MTRHITSAFSMKMVPFTECTILVREVPLDEATVWVRKAPFHSGVGHASTAVLMSSALGVDIPFNRADTKMEKGDELLIYQYTGPRLEEGVTELPTGASATWLRVDVL